MRKSEVLALLQDMPEEIDADTFIYTLHLKRKLELALADIEAGRVFSQDEAERQIEQWLK